ncbi:response regulator transcription factor [Derxia gummosa]|uniref:Response regulator transcription factor n=1 Tax=Derxia gummosa DSM 723 TaxID=1121388 RepID=A0A8B6XAF2_9BURK|nr:response regulator transcription factor [Derxia gummosa]
MINEQPANETGGATGANEQLVPARIVIVDDHTIVRHGIAELLHREPDLRVVAEAGDAEEAINVISNTELDLAIVDISMPGMSGIDLVKRLVEIRPELPIIMMSMHDESLYSDRAYRAGAKGYVMKQEASDRLLLAIRKVLKGGVYVSDRMQTIMLQRYLNAGDSVSFIDNLTDREFEILRLIGQGLSVQDIAEKLGRSAKTIEAHRANLREKLGIRKAAELTRFATQWVERGN